MNKIDVTLLWWDDRDGRGVVEDSDGNEYYIDSSVLKIPSADLMKNTVSRTGMELCARLNPHITNHRCAMDIDYRCDHSDFTENGICGDCGAIV